MKWEIYKQNYIREAKAVELPDKLVKENLNYAYTLYNKDIPIIYDQKHLSLLLGIDYSYLIKISNSSDSGYRKFSILKKSGSKRIIHEPLPNLKYIQRWILDEILGSITVSPFAKAYKKNVSIKENVRFHKNQKQVLRLDIKDYFGSIKQRQVLKVFLNLGYSPEVSVILSKLCTLNNKLPQGAPTSSYLSNVVMMRFDEEISEYCYKNKIRYTRYADDMTFSGEFNTSKLIYLVKKILKWNNLYLNKEKTHLMRRHNRQLVTGITVNEKIQVTRPIRRQLRQEIYFIKKYGIKEHLRTIEKSAVNPEFHLKSLLSKVGYCKFINPQDTEFTDYYTFLSNEIKNLIE